MSFRRDVYSMTTCSEWGWVQYLYRQLGLHLNQCKLVQTAHPLCSVKYRTTHLPMNSNNKSQLMMMSAKYDNTSPCQHSAINPQQPEQQMKPNENKMVDMAQMKPDKTRDGCETEWSKHEANKTKQIQHRLQLKTWTKGIRSDINKYISMNPKKLN